MGCFEVKNKEFTTYFEPEKVISEPKNLIFLRFLM